ncbi:hypothetical protein GCM10023091_28960 [Ravibacter arvi]|uniref:Nucleotidyl transferase AbiEii/AbiGii toxin family protein n=1 Tax=Ravibacter arvi TaxID=2051041 RepID=A0ABP8M4A3_9BACT
MIEKDYWIMQVLHGLTEQGFSFELKGGTSLSKGYQIIDIFSEDIDIHIKAPAGLKVNENPKNTKASAVESRKFFYDWLAEEIHIDGIVSVERDTSFDDIEHYRSGGIRLRYRSVTDVIEGVKEGILLEAGFDTVTPNRKITISSWAFDRAHANPKIKISDNRAADVICYHPGYTFVEKLQTIATKFRQEQQGAKPKANVMRQYYDLSRLLGHEDVRKFIGTPEYNTHKQARFPSKDLEIPIRDNQAFLLSDPVLRDRYRKRFENTASLYYKGQPDFEEVMSIILSHLGGL